MAKIRILLEIFIIGLLFEGPRLGVSHFLAIAATAAAVTNEICGVTPSPILSGGLRLIAFENTKYL
jgi:hypothetical protein